MPSSLRTPKTLADWLDLDAHRRGRWFRNARGWRLLLLGVLLACAAGVALPAVLGKRRAYQAAPLAGAHALFNDDCAKCHQGHFETATRLWRGDGDAHSVPDGACLQCHSGHVHHDTQTEERHCAGCHHEHRGQPALTRIADAHCTSCHADLKRNDGQPPGYDAHVTGFAPGQHPDFGKRADPGTIRFNHAVHLKPEGVLTIDEKQRQSLRGPEGAPFEEDAPKKTRVLACADCHQPDDAGHLMRPISYQQHCKECHPMGAQVAGDWFDEKAKGNKAANERRRRAWDFAAESVPHPSPYGGPATVRAHLRDRLARFIADKDNAELFLGKQPDGEPARPLPGQPPRPALDEKAFAWVEKHLTKTEAVLFDRAGGCRFCHTETEGPRQQGLPDYLPARIRERWYEHSVFSHEAHRMAACTECHAAAASEKTSDVLLPVIDTCRRCHDPDAPARARTDCVECHVYHDPRKGKAPERPLRIDELIGR
jgi:predicted CXXCH cytochrome family protein